ncbi:MAG: cytochrome c biogenesis CcdA family protein [Alphaproteobacteria bacterium]
MFEVGYGAAVIAGLLSFLSPCVLPLVPPYLCYVAGISLKELTEDGIDSQMRRRIMLSAFLFVLGFTTVFMLLGATASALGNLVTDYASILSRVAGGIIIVLGLHFMGVFKIGFLYKEARFQADTTGLKQKGLSLIGAYLVGLAFAFGWTPCVGPVLAAILFMASGGDTISQGLWLLFAYSAGLGIPFLLSAYFASHFLKFMARFRQHLGKIEFAIGLILVITGGLFLTGTMSSLGFILLDLFPALGKIG